MCVEQENKVSNRKMFFHNLQAAVFTQKYIAQHVASFRNRNMRFNENLFCTQRRLRYLHWCAFNWLQSFILNKSFHSTMSFAHKLQKWVSIVVPKLWQFSAGWKLATGQFQSDFHSSVPNVVVILHTTRQRVPSCSIGCSIAELRGSNLKNFNFILRVRNSNTYLSHNWKEELFFSRK